MGTRRGATVTEPIGRHPPMTKVRVPILRVFTRALPLPEGQKPGHAVCPSDPARQNDLISLEQRGRALGPDDTRGGIHVGFCSAVETYVRDLREKAGDT